MSLLVGLLLSFYVVATATSVRHKSITFDELAHLTAGFSSWSVGDHRLFTQNGQLPKRWAALPLVVLGFRFPSLDQEAWRSSDLERLGYQFLYAIGNDHEALLWYSRMAMIPIGVLLGVVCYAWARRLFGIAGGLVALCAFVFSPGMLAHGPLATSDVASALLFTATLASFWLVLHRASPLRLLGSGLVMGLLFVTKMSAVVIVPVAVILIVLRVWGGRPIIWSNASRSVVSDRRRLLLVCSAMLAAHLVVVFVVIWAFYGFRYEMFRERSPRGDRQFLGETIDTIADGTLARPLILRARDLRLLPEAYLFGFAHVLDRSGRMVGFFNGKYSVAGWWSFFPYVWLVKTPFALFGLLALAVACGWRTLRAVHTRRRAWRLWYRLAPLLTFLAVYWATAVTSSLNLGERHLLPTYPALFILAGGAAGWIRRRRVVSTVAVAGALLWLCIESIGAWPHYLAYFNRLAGGPANGYRHLVDSSLDWGQDLPGLKRWLDTRRGEADPQLPVYLSYFGSGNPATYGLDVRQIYSYQEWRSDPPFYELSAGIYCVSATMLQSIYTRAPGPWAAPYEEAYQRLKREIEEKTADSRPLTTEFDELRFARLSAFLRRRTPDDQIGYSILVFRLSAEDLRTALDGPPVELWAQPAVEQR